MLSVSDQALMASVLDGRRQLWRPWMQVTGLSRVTIPRDVVGVRQMLEHVPTFVTGDTKILLASCHP